MKEKIIEILENHALDICIEGFGDNSEEELSQIADEILELFKPEITEGKPRMRITYPDGRIE